MGCDQPQSKEIDANQPRFSEPSSFIGCYTIDLNKKPQIKISQGEHSLMMQMPETEITNKVWDVPEPLEAIGLEQVDKYYSFDAEDIDGLIGRPDRLLVLARVKSAFVNLNPLLSSEYQLFIYNASNDVYKVDCEYEPANLISTEKNVENSLDIK